MLLPLLLLPSRHAAATAPLLLPHCASCRIPAAPLALADMLLAAALLLLLKSRWAATEAVAATVLLPSPLPVEAAAAATDHPACCCAAPRSAPAACNTSLRRADILLGDG